MKDKQEESEKKQEEKRKYHFLKSREGDKKYNEADRKQFLKYLGLYLFGMVFMELIFHLFAYGELGNRIYMPLIFGIFWGGVFAFVTMLFRPKGRMILGGAIFLFVWFIFSAQLVYYHIFGTHISLSLLGVKILRQGVVAVTWRIDQLSLGIGGIIIALLVPRPEVEGPDGVQVDARSIHQVGQPDPYHMVNDHRRHVVDKGIIGIYQVHTPQLVQGEHRLFIIRAAEIAHLDGQRVGRVAAKFIVIQGGGGAEEERRRYHQGEQAPAQTGSVLSQQHSLPAGVACLRPELLMFRSPLPRPRARQSAS